jgi:putative membrane protein
MSRFTEGLQARVKTKIEELESKTSVEFVPVIVERSNSYFLFRLTCCALTALAAQSLIHAFGGISESHLLNTTLSLAVGLLAFPFFSMPPVFRFLAPKRLRQIEVEEGAQLAFLREQVFQTQARTGVLIYISELEHEVFVLADHGLLKVMSPEEWSQIGSQLAQELAHSTAETLVFTSLDLVAQRLAEHFPARSNNENEISNELREK